MHKISYWAGRNIVAGRTLIVALKIATWLLAGFIGTQLHHSYLFLPIYTCYLLAGFLLVAAVYFCPAVDKSIAAKWVNFKRRKTCDFIMTLASSIVIIASVNNAGLVTSYSPANGISFTKEKTVEEILNSGKKAASLSKHEIRLLTKEFSHQLKVFGKAVASGDKAASNNAWKIALAIVAMVGLIILIAALSCTLACNGSDAAAILLAVFGIGGVIFGFIAVMNAISRKPKTEVAAPKE